MAETVLVLGSNSFSGSHFVDGALQQGLNVIGVSRSAEPDIAFLPYRWSVQHKRASFHFYQADLNHDLDKIMLLIHQHKPAYVVNFAAQAMVAESWAYPEHWMMTNVVSTIKFHDQLRRCDFLKKYVHISTPEVYGSCEGLVQENTNYHPSTPYAVSRAACDLSLMSFVKNYQFPVVFTRAANVYGPGQQLYRIIPKTILSIKLGKKLPLHGGGKSVRSFIHIRDVVDGTLKAMLQAKAGEIFHLSTRENIAIVDLVRLLCKKLNVNFDKTVEIVGERAGKDAAYLLDSARAHQQLKWQPKVSLDTGVEETVAWVEERFEKLKQMPLNYIHKA